MDCSISGNNKFMLSRQNDIVLGSGGITALRIAGNQFYGGQGTSLNVQAVGAGLQILGNHWDSPGNYAADFSTSRDPQRELLHSSFCGHRAAGERIRQSLLPIRLRRCGGFEGQRQSDRLDHRGRGGLRAGAFPAYSSGNRSGWATGDVYVYTGAGNTIASANERAYNGMGVTSVFSTLTDPSTGNAGFAGNLNIGGDLTARDIPGRGISCQQVRQHPGRNQRCLQ